MNKILAHIDRITRNRDRMLLDVSIIQALAELTASPCINLYCVLEGPAGSAATLVARHDQAGLTCWTDDDPERPEEALADGTLLARCHQQRVRSDGATPARMARGGMLSPCLTAKGWRACWNSSCRGG